MQSFIPEYNTIECKLIKYFEKLEINDDITINSNNDTLLELMDTLKSCNDVKKSEIIIKNILQTMY